MNPIENQTPAPRGRLRPITYWWLWVLDTGLVAAGLLFYLATNYGTAEFFGRACAMALLPLIPLLVLVGGAGSTIFALTKVLIERRDLPPVTARALLVGPALALTVALLGFGAARSPAHRLAYICLGSAPAAASEIRITGYSTFLNEEWLAVFHVGQKDFAALLTQAKLAPLDGFAFQKAFAASALARTRLGQSLPPLTNAVCGQRVFKESEEHQRGSVCAAFDPATGTAAVLRMYHD